MPRRLAVAAMLLLLAVAAAFLTKQASLPHGGQPVCGSSDLARGGTITSALGSAKDASFDESADLGDGDVPPAPLGQRLVFADNFDGTRLDCSRWTVFSGQPKSSSVAYWLPSQVSVGGGMLRLRTAWDPALRRYVSGGLSTVHDAAGIQEYGTYLMRFRVDAGNGVGDVALLYPKNGHWPPEIDITESGGSRTSAIATLHYGAANSEIHRTVAANFATWHVAGVRWERGSLTFLLDGRVYATIRSSRVPAQPMWFGIQTQESPCPAGFSSSCRSAATPPVVDMDVDWVAIYR